MSVCGSGRLLDYSASLCGRDDRLLLLLLLLLLPIAAVVLLLPHLSSPSLLLLLLLHILLLLDRLVEGAVQPFFPLQGFPHHRALLEAAAAAAVVADGARDANSAHRQEGETRY